VSSFLLFSGLFIYQCQKSDLPTAPAEKQKIENTFNTQDVQDFVAQMNAVKNGDLTSRSGPYTLAQLLNNVSNGINFEYNHPSTFQNKKFQFVDTIQILNANDAYSDAQAATVYQTILNKANVQAQRVGTSGVYLISVSSKIIAMTTTTVDLEIYGTYANALSAIPSSNDTIYMPGDRFFEEYGSCENIYDDSYMGAARFLQSWIKRILISYPMQSNTYLANEIYVENAFDWTKDYWDDSYTYHYSHSFRTMLLQPNLNDPTPSGDGHYDYVTKAYTFKKGEAEEMRIKGCVSPDELSYYATNVKPILATQLSAHSKTYYTFVKVEARYQEYKFDDDYQFASWQFRTYMANLVQSDGPIPQKDILDPS